MYKKLTTIIILNDEKFEIFPLISETRQEFPHSPQFFSIILEVLANEIRKENEIRVI